MQAELRDIERAVTVARPTPGGSLRTELRRQGARALSDQPDLIVFFGRLLPS
jgi:hypothetical protein